MQCLQNSRLDGPQAGIERLRVENKNYITK